MKNFKGMSWLFMAAVVAIFTLFSSCPVLSAPSTINKNELSDSGPLEDYVESGNNNGQLSPTEELAYYGASRFDPAMEPMMRELLVRYLLTSGRDRLFRNSEVSKFRNLRNYKDYTEKRSRAGPYSKYCAFNAVSCFGRKK